MLLMCCHMLLCWLAGLRCVAAFGGLSKFEQFKELKAGMPCSPLSLSPKTMALCVGCRFGRHQ